MRTLQTKRPAKTWRVLLLVTIIVGLLSTAGLTLAQSSAAYDLGCRGAFTSGGGERQSGAFRLFDAAGQTAVGETSSTQYTLRAGYIQDQTLSLATSGTSTAASPTVIEDDGTLFLPIIRNVMRVVRPCSYS